jgi:hypothetical protein
MYAGSRNPWSACEIQDEKAIASEMFVQQAAHANADVSASPLRQRPRHGEHPDRCSRIVRATET